MAIRYTLIHQDATTLPTLAAQNLSNGINLPGGMIDEIIVRVTGTVTAADILADFQNVFSQARFIINGVNVFDWRAGYGSAIQATPSQLGYMLNSMGAQRSKNTSRYDGWVKWRISFRIHTRLLRFGYYFYGRISKRGF